MQDLSQFSSFAEIKSKLDNAIRQNRLAHALLFMGQEGALNLPLALAIARMIHCKTKEENCTCEACSQSQKYIHPDTLFLFPTVKENKEEESRQSDLLKEWRGFLLQQPHGNVEDWLTFCSKTDKQAFISVDSCRHLIGQLALKPYESNSKVIVLWLPEKMHTDGANALLKSLEEPPPNTYFLLVTQQAETLLTTIVSRTIPVAVPLLSDEDIALYARENLQLASPEIATVVSIADGKLRELFTWSNPDQSYAHVFFDWMLACYQKQYMELTEMATKFHELDKLQQRMQLSYLLSMLHEMMLTKWGVPMPSLLPDDLKSRMEKLAKLMDVPAMETIYGSLNQALYHLERNGNTKMIFFNTSLQVSQLWQW